MINQPILTLELLCERKCSMGEDNDSNMDSNNQMSTVYFYLFGVETIPLLIIAAHGM